MSGRVWPGQRSSDTPKKRKSVDDAERCVAIMSFRSSRSGDVQRSDRLVRYAIRQKRFLAFQCATWISAVVIASIFALNDVNAGPSPEPNIVAWLHALPAPDPPRPESCECEGPARGV